MKRSTKRKFDNSWQWERVKLFSVTHFCKQGKEITDETDFKLVKKLKGQTEIGKKSRYHWQCALETIHPMTISEVKKNVFKNKKGFWVERARNKEALFNYIRKDVTKAEDKKKIDYVSKPTEEDKLNAWDKM